MKTIELAALARRLHRAGQSDTEIGVRLGISSRTVLRLRHTRPGIAEQPLVERPEPGWHQHAACTREQPVATDWSAPGDTTESVAAMNVCALRCPVRALCLAETLHIEGGDGVSHREGIAGGLTPKQRYAVYRELYDRSHTFKEAA
ncbi:WhiB family transcriptional regulator [Streptomyces sp. NPDC054784]